MLTQTFTLTFGDQAENHAGMQKLGSMAPDGFTRDDLERARLWFLERGAEPVLYDLRSLLPAGVQAEEAYLLVVPRCPRALLSDRRPDCPPVGIRCSRAPSTPPLDRSTRLLES